MELQLPPVSNVYLVGIVATALYLLYRLALPKPLPDIPYHKSSAQRILGDVPALTAHEAEGGSLITYLNSSVRTLDSPLIQIFLKPWERPVLVLADYREVHNLLMHRKEFDRSSTISDLLKGLAPDHHIHLKTDATFRAQRRLTQDIMLPSFLNDVAGPAIYQSLLDVVELWRVKAEMAAGRPWAATGDVKLMTLDSILTFAFGNRPEHNASRSTLELVRDLQDDPEARKVWDAQAGGVDQAVEFPQGQPSDVLEAMLVLNATVMELYGAPFPKLKWAYVNRKPRVRKATKNKNAYFAQQVAEAVKRQEHATEDSAAIKSAVDQMVFREKNLAEKDGRKPRLFSGVMMDEILGFVFAGSETTAAAICWALKFLTNHASVQARLRNALRDAFPAAHAEGRNPTIHEITSARIPYLDATMEEVLRCAGTSPFLDRATTTDTELVGYHVPRGTVVLCLHQGPSMMSPAFAIDESRRHTGASKAQDRGDRAWDNEDIAAFQPARWLVRGAAGDEQFDPTAGPQLAFGLGPRACFGRRLVYLQLRILLTLLFWRFELDECPPAYAGDDAVLRTANEPKHCYVRLRETKWAAAS